MMVMGQNSNLGQHLSSLEPGKGSETTRNSIAVNLQHLQVDQSILDIQCSAACSENFFSYSWVLTKDGSLTLKSFLEPSEWMHSLQGAYSESQFIYGDAVRQALKTFDRKKTFSVFSMGLGLGYVELIVICECLKVGQAFEVHTYESDKSLQTLFEINYHLFLMILRGLKIESDITDLYKTKFDLKIEELKVGFSDFFLRDYKLSFSRNKMNQSEPETSNLQNSSGQIFFEGPFTESNLSTNSNNFHLILYDAFSSNTQNELWNEDFLTLMIKKLADPNFCIFSTYAKVGNLTRSLKSSGFKIEKKKGYAFKRESTFAHRR